MFGGFEVLPYLWGMNNNNNTPATAYCVTETTTTPGFNGIGTTTTTARIVGLTFEDYGDAAEAAKAYAQRTGVAYIAPGMEAKEGTTFVEVATK